MTGEAQEALAQFNEQQDRLQTKEAFDARMNFIEATYMLLDIALSKNKDEYKNLTTAFESGESVFAFKTYVMTSDADEKLAVEGVTYKPVVLFILKNVNQIHTRFFDTQSNELLVAIPVQESFTLTDESQLSDIKLTNTVYVYLRTDDGQELGFEIAASGVRMVELDTQSNGDAISSNAFSMSAVETKSEAVTEMLRHITADSFTKLDTGAALIATLRQDLVNLKLVPFSEEVIGYPELDLR